ncbi:MAG: hypothetical protein ACI4UE_00660 [Candidatus Scatovivens sp.]
MDDLTILNEIHKGVTMGMSSLETISNKVGDLNFKDNLSFQYNRYQDTLDKVNKKFEEAGEIPDDTPINLKVMGWTGIQLNTISNKSNSQISEILIQGNDMGIIKAVKLLNQNPQASQETKNILNEFIKLQENNIEQLKKFL